MKVFLAVFLSLASKFGYCECPPDTIANWQIYYGDRLITSGNENRHRVPLVGKIFITDKVDKLTIHYQYDSKKPVWRTIVKKSGQEVLFEGAQQLKDNHPSSINFKKIPDREKGHPFTIQIYYTDNVTREKNRFIGEIEIKNK